MAEINLGDVNKTLAGQGGYLAEIAQDTKTFDIFGKLFLTNAYMQRNREKELSENQKQTHKGFVEMKGSFDIFSNTMSQFAETNKTFANIMQNFSRLISSFNGAVNRFANAEEKRLKQERADRLDALETKAEQGDLLVQQGSLGLRGGGSGLSETSLAAMAGIYASNVDKLNAAPNDPDNMEEEEATSSFTDKIIDAGKEVAIWGGGLFAGYKGLELFTKNTDDAAKSLNNVSKVNTKIADDIVDAGADLAKYGNQARNARVLSGVSGSELSFLSDTVGDDYKKFMKGQKLFSYGLRNSDDVLRQLDDVAGLGMDYKAIADSVDAKAKVPFLDKLKQFPNLKRMGKLLLKILGPLVIGLDMKDMYEIDQLVKEEKQKIGRELGIDPSTIMLTESELNKVTSGYFGSIDDGGGSYTQEEKIQLQKFGVLGDVQGLKDLLEQEEIAKRTGNAGSFIAQDNSSKSNNVSQNNNYRGYNLESIDVDDLITSYANN